MQHGRLGQSVLSLSFLLAVTACGGSGEADGLEEALGTSQEPALAAIGSKTQRGMRWEFWNVANPTGLPLANIVNVAACSDKALYAVEKRLSSLQPPPPPASALHLPRALQQGRRSDVETGQGHPDQLGGEVGRPRACL